MVTERVRAGLVAQRPAISPVCCSRSARRWTAARELAAMRDHGCCVGVGCPAPPRRIPPASADEHRPALTWSGALGGWAGPSRRDCGSGRRLGRRGNRLVANVLAVAVVVEVSDREDARGFDSGRFALLADFSCGGE